MTIKIGIAGMGFMGQSHFTNCLALSRETGLYQIIAIADPEPLRRAGYAPVVGNIDAVTPHLDMTNVECYLDAADMIDRADLDVVYICLPTSMHASMSVRALRRGRHVFCEKPMALSLAEADQMVAAARETGACLLIGHVLRFWPEFKYLKDTAASGRLGALRSLSLTRLGAAPIWSWHNWMRDEQQSGGGLIDLQIHDIDVVHWVAGVPDAVSAHGWNTSTPGGIDWVDSSYHYGPGLSVHSHGGWQSYPSFKGFEVGYEAFFERGWIRFNPSAQHKLTEHAAGAAEPTYFESSGNAYANEDRFFLSCVAEGKDPGSVISPEDARTTVQIALALEASARRDGVQVAVRGV